MRLREVSAADLDRVADVFAITLDDERRRILSHRDSADIRACAGSGKTTLLVAKLALLVPSWPDRFRGIAILSHTNVAHREIRCRFSAMPGLRLLESYPHFIGTIQSFIDMTLAIPGMKRRFGTGPVLIGNEVCGDRAAASILHQRYTGARAWLSRRSNGEELLRSLRLEYKDEGDLVVASAAGSLPSAESETTRALSALKMHQIRNGLCRYDDMDACAQWYAHHYPAALMAVARRFPVVFIDEAQDTSALQAGLLDRTFGDCVVLQRFGDDRQAIYRSEGDSDGDARFPKPGYLSMTTSCRLSVSTAKLVENVCNGNVEPLSGSSARPDHRHTVFSFAANRIKEVLPAFARLVATELGTGIPANRVMAVGARRTGVTDAAKFPMIIADYWEPGAGARSPADTRFGTLAEYVAAALHDVRLHSSLANPRARLLRAACRILELQGIVLDGRPHTPSSLVSQLRDSDHRHAPKLLVSISTLLLSAVNTGECRIDRVSTLLKNGLVGLCSGVWNESVIHFCESPSTTQDGVANADGLFRLDVGDGRVEVGVGTIHSVKGETLDAVLVLTTFFHKHDLRELAEKGFLCGRRPGTAEGRGVQLREHVKRAYVAMTRPTRLLCLAMHQDHISTDSRTAMERLGWSFQVV